MSNLQGVAVELVELSKRFGDLVAVNSLSLSVERGEIFGLLGPNGSGKTTTVNIISGLTRPTSGRALILGHDITHDARAVRAKLGSIPQETALYEELTAWRNMAIHADLYGVPRRERDDRISGLLDLVQLSDRASSRVGTFSGGMKRRLALARALLHDPELLYMDEPTLGVDIQSRRALWDHLLDLKTRGKTVLITTNYLEEANELCDRLAILDRGKLVAMDTPANLKRRFGTTVLEMSTECQVPPELLDRLLAITGVSDVSTENHVLKVTVGEDPSVTGRVVTLVTQGAQLRSIIQREPNLDEVFLSLTGTALRD